MSFGLLDKTQQGWYSTKMELHNIYLFLMWQNHCILISQQRSPFEISKPPAPILFNLHLRLFLHSKRKVEKRPIHVPRRGKSQSDAATTALSSTESGSDKKKKKKKKSEFKV